MKIIMNPLGEYRNAGKRAAMAVRNRDMANAKWWDDWMVRALRGEDEGNKAQCREAFQEGYRQESGLLGGMIHK